MRRGLLVLFTAYFALVACLLLWALWLLATDDPDGGRHPVGGAMLLAALALGIAGTLALRRGRT